MTKDKVPEFWIIGGTNRSGKSTLVNLVKNKIKNNVDVINPDNIAIYKGWASNLNSHMLSWNKSVLL